MIDLKTILKQHPNCLSSRAALKSVLMDRYPTEKRIVNILTILFECGVADKIKSAKSIGTNEMQVLITKIENDYGILGKYSQEAILAWAAAFSVTASETQIPTATPVPASEYKPSEQKPVVYVQGDVDDYDVILKSDGYYISHFNGFEEEDMIVPSLIEGNKIKGIAEDAFKGCVTVKRICISEGIETIENGAFKKCTALEEIRFPNTLRCIGSNSNEYGIGAFFKTNLRDVIIPQNVEYLGPYSFGFCSNLRSVKLSDKISTIHKNAFSYCTRLANIQLPSGLTEIQEEAFESCLSLREVYIPVGTQSIGGKAFDSAPLTKIYIPPTVTKIGEQATRSFSFSSGLSDSIFGYIPGSVTIYCAAGSAAMDYARKNNIKCAKAQF